MEHEIFEIGNTVSLRSGGPAMTVKSVKEDLVECLWFFESEVRCGTFPKGTLEHVAIADDMDDEEEEYEDEVVGF